jgi:predicted transcriptional regulator
MMSLVIEMRRAVCQAESSTISSTLSCLEGKGYTPLITQAKGHYLEVFGALPSEAVRPIIRREFFSAAYEYAFARALRTRYREEFGVPVGGDLFFGPSGNGVLYVLFVTPERPAVHRPRKADLTASEVQIGYVGEEKDAASLDDFATLVSEALSEQGQAVEWTPLQPSNPQFRQLADSEDTKFVSATVLSKDEIEVANQLEDQDARALAILIRRGGGILSSDLARKTSVEPEQAQNSIQQLMKAGLLSREYVVICRQTSNQVNRVRSREAIDKMGEMNVLCSCGRPISDERVEELFSPAPLLQRMLDQSYWMVAKLVQLLSGLRIAGDRVLLNLQEGPEEIDAFVDLDGTLLMFELKDGEFSMGHAYPFGGRIGLYKPDYAIIVSTGGIAPDVKQYFQRVKPEAEIVYVGTLEDLTQALLRVMTTVRSLRAVDLLSQFDPMATIEIGVSEALAPKIGIDPDVLRRRR